VLDGFYIVSYGLAIFVLNLLLGFLSPRVDPDFASLGVDDDDDDASVGLPTTDKGHHHHSHAHQNHSHSHAHPHDDASSSSSLSSSGDVEFKPFIRRLPEFKFWLAVTRAVLLSIVLTFFPFLDIPVFWPILVVYFFALFFVTMRKQIQHMLKHKYIPFSFGKPTFSSQQSAAPRRAD